MLLDILKFLFIYCLVLLAFANGLNQLYFYYETRAIDEPNNCKGIRCEKQNNAFSTLFETLQSLFWSVFGLLNLYVTNVKARHEFTEFVGATMFGTYNVISLVVLLNMLIAMMNNSYQLIADHADIEWKFARTKLWMSYFDEGGTLPPPFNIIPSPKSFLYLGNWFNNTFCPKRDPDGRRRRHNLRSFTELKQDISSFRYEVLDLLGNRKHPRRSFSTSSAEFSQRDDTNDGSGGARAKSKSVSFNLGCKKKACHGAPLIRTMPRASDAQGKSKAESSSKRSFMGPSFKKLGLLFSKFNGHTSEAPSEPMYTISDGIAQQHYMWQDIRYSQMEKGKAEACSQSEMNLSEVELGSHTHLPTELRDMVSSPYQLRQINLPVFVALQCYTLPMLVQ
ncbi:hypothetical protein A6R68_03898 [Neotoma lepida]|uniref:Ion transport domain-containing protein n=1 Tax=Neotoma lepida TaxID=56216 RepID=A0A1A6GMP5_NEOLE|nr:hypothetical protein A6R68_03898 [Neotoma lepida]